VTSDLQGVISSLVGPQAALEAAFRGLEALSGPICRV
jgi:hypothetical protein